MQEYTTPPPSPFGQRYLACWVGAGGTTSLSPPMYDQAFRELGVAGIQHRIAFDDPQIQLSGREADDGLARVVEIIRTTGWCGGSVTHPFKEAILPLCDELDPTAAAMGAVNTIVVREGRVTGYNTDWIGVAESLREAGLSDTGSNRQGLGPVAVIGVGGVARAVCFALYQVGASELRLFDPVPGKADDVATAMRATFAQEEEAKHLGNRTGTLTEIVAVETVECALDGVFGICQCSPVGMAGHPGVPFSPALLSPSCTTAPSDASLNLGVPPTRWLLECIYTPVETELVCEARQRGLMTITGDRLNLHQFLRQFELVTGLRPKFDAAEEFFRTLLDVAAEASNRESASALTPSKM